MSSTYQAALWEAYLAGFYVPELESLYFRHESFQTPHLFVMDTGH